MQCERENGNRSNLSTQSCTKASGFLAAKRGENGVNYAGYRCKRKKMCISDAAGEPRMEFAYFACMSAAV
jgi:hypothetical protein